MTNDCLTHKLPLGVQQDFSAFVMYRKLLKVFVYSEEIPKEIYSGEYRSGNDPLKLKV
jgi:hypothetical protein